MWHSLHPRTRWFDQLQDSKYLSNVWHILGNSGVSTTRRYTSSNVRSLFRLCTIDATKDHLKADAQLERHQPPGPANSHLVPYLSIPLTSFSSSSGAQPPLTTSEAILANQRLRQSLFVLLGTCLAMACHLEGFGFSGSSADCDKHEKIMAALIYEPRSTASRRSWSSLAVQDRRSLQSMIGM